MYIIVYDNKCDLFVYVHAMFGLQVLTGTCHARHSNGPRVCGQGCSDAADNGGVANGSRAVHGGCALTTSASNSNLLSPSTSMPIVGAHCVGIWGRVKGEMRCVGLCVCTSLAVLEYRKCDLSRLCLDLGVTHSH